MIRPLLASFVVGLTAGACGAFESEPVTAPPKDGGTTASDDAHSSADGGTETVPDAGVACVASQKTDDFTSNSIVGWDTTLVGGAALDASKSTLKVLLAGSEEERGYLRYDHPQTPCRGHFDYRFAFRANVKNRSAPIAGPRLGGVYASVDPGTNGFKNHVEVGFGFKERAAVLSLTDDACTNGPTPAVCGDVGQNGSLVKGMADGWRDFVIEIATADGDPAHGYGSIKLTADGTSQTFVLPFPMHLMKLETYAGVSLSRAGAREPLELDDVAISLTPR